MNTLPTVDQLKDAFPQATEVSCNLHNSCVGLMLGATHFRVTLGPNGYTTRYGDGRGRAGLHPTDWRQCILDTVDLAHARYLRQAREFNAAASALAEAINQ